MNTANWTYKQWAILFLSIFVVFAGVILVYQNVSATPPSGVTGTTLVTGDLPELIQVKFKEVGSGFGDGDDVKQIRIAKFVAAPGGSFGWHQHGGPLWVIVSSGTLSYIDGTNCQLTLYPAGSVLFDSGNKTHSARNEGNEPIELYIVYMLPEGGLPRIDVPDPGVCSSP